MLVKGATEVQVTTVIKVFVVICYLLLFLFIQAKFQITWTTTVCDGVEWRVVICTRFHGITCCKTCHVSLIKYLRIQENFPLSKLISYQFINLRIVNQLKNNMDYITSCFYQRKYWFPFLARRIYKFLKIFTSLGSWYFLPFSLI